MILNYELFTEKLKNSNSEQEIKESLRFLLEEKDEEILEAWYNTILDLAALVPGVGSFAEGLNLMSYAKQGEYLLAGLCAIGLIPIFGQYVGAGGSILVKILRSGGKLGAGILEPLTKLIAKLFPSITKFLKSAAFTKKFPGIESYTDEMIKALASFSLKGGKDLSKISLDAKKVYGLKKDIVKGKSIVKLGNWLFGNGKKIDQPIKQFTQYDVEKSINPGIDWTEYLKGIPT